MAHGSSLEVARAKEALQAEAAEIDDVELAAIALRLASYLDMARVWERLGSKHVRAVLKAIRFAKLRAEDEAGLPTRTEERTELERVRRAAQELKSAIENSPLPRSTSIRTDSSIWITLRKGAGTESDRTISLPALLDELCRQLDGSSFFVPRMVHRATKDPLWPAFLRWFDFALIAHEVQISPAMLAIIMNAVTDDVEQSWDEDKVKGVLRDPKVKALKRSKRRS